MGAENTPSPAGLGRRAGTGRCWRCPVKCPAREEMLQHLQAMADGRGDREWLCHPESLVWFPVNTQILSGAQKELREDWWHRRDWWPSPGGVWVVFHSPSSLHPPGSKFPFNIPGSSLAHDSQGMLLCFIATTLMKRPLEPRLLW